MGATGNSHRLSTISGLSSLKLRSHKDPTLRFSIAALRVGLQSSENCQGTKSFSDLRGASPLAISPNPPGSCLGLSSRREFDGMNVSSSGVVRTAHHAHNRVRSLPAPLLSPFASIARLRRSHMLSSALQPRSAGKPSPPAAVVPVHLASHEQGISAGTRGNGRCL